MEKAALPLKYRPQTLDEIVGNKETVEAVRKIMERDRAEIPHSFLLQGPSGCGKTTLARIMAKLLGCKDADFRELNTANSRGIDSIREIAQNATYTPLSRGVKIYLLDEVHQLTKDAQHATLKMLEDAPPDVYFILATTEPEKLLTTVKTRCTTFQLSALRISELEKILKDVCSKESVADFPAKSLRNIAMQSGGSPREALKLLDTVIDITEDDLIDRAVVKGTSSDTQIIDLCRALIEKKWDEVQKCLVNLNTDEPENIRYAILGYMGAIILKSDKPVDALVERTRLFFNSFMYTKKAGLVTACYCFCNNLIPRSDILVKGN